MTHFEVTGLPQIADHLFPQAQEKLIKYYAELRENDCTGSARAAYRITVRQLESMVRLSEALAKMHCDLVSAASKTILLHRYEFFVCACLCQRLLSCFSATVE